MVGLGPGQKNVFVSSSGSSPFYFRRRFFVLSQKMSLALWSFELFWISLSSVAHTKGRENTAGHAVGAGLDCSPSLIFTPREDVSIFARVQLGRGAEQQQQRRGARLL
jgi:hypothetical protein